MKTNRPDPEKLLKRIQEEEKQEKTGKLKIYLGASPGVGKTYTMLEEALDKRSHGLDVVIGVIETHGRREIETLLKSFEIIPKQSLEYHGQTLYELDLDAILKRNPALVLIDEMAHTNVPGLRHTKRWQDIKELLDRGINVDTTLNVQHIESLNDVVSQIIHVHVKETVPDSMLELASTIELVDLPPEDLLKRLQEGKVYFPAQAEIAKNHFFLKGNLIALRELALRVTAERVSKQVLSYRQGLGIRYIWPTKEKLLVCISHKSSSGKLIRVARRLANRLGAEWIAVHVQTPYVPLSEEQKNNAIHHLRLAEKLGGQTCILTGPDIVNEIMTFAHEQNVTEIVIWKHIRPRWKEFFSRSLADDIVRKSGEIDIYVVTSERTDYQPPIKTIPKKTFPLYIYILALAMSGFSTLIATLLFPYLHTSGLLMIYLLGVTVVASFGYTIPSILASVASILCYQYFFIEPYYDLGEASFQSIFTLAVMLIITLMISNLAILNRRQIDMSRFREKHTASLHALTRALACTRGVDNLLKTTVNYVSDVFNSDVMVLLFENNQLTIRAARGAENTLSDKEYSVATWVYNMGQIAGLGTDTLPFSNAIYIPLLASQTSIGVMRIRPIHTHPLFSPEQMHLLEACANQLAIAIEADRLHKEI